MSSSIKLILEKLDSSNVHDLSGHMIGCRPLAENQDPTLVVLDGHRLKFFGFDIVTDVDDQPDQLPVNFTLSQNYPNPFNPTTEIAFLLPEGSDVTLTVFNSLGQEVRVLVDEYLRKGVHQVGWDGTDISGNPVGSGLYFYHIQAGDISATKKMVLLK